MPPRVAFFPDSFHEVNGVAHTARNFVAFAGRSGLPMLCVRAGEREPAYAEHGNVCSLELRRSRWAVRLEQDLWFDPLFLRHGAAVARALEAFRPDVVHITGPSEMGILGAYFAWKLGVPLVASWHTNVHEYAARRGQWLTRRMGGAGAAVERGIEAGALAATARFYRLARVLYAPNPGLCALLEERTGRPCYPMQRGVETELFSPARRTRGADGELVLGYVGRLSVEKNVGLLPRVDAGLRERGVRARWVLVGHGAEEERLRREMPAERTAFAGILRGEALAQAYADMDVLVFPSHTDTFGNVVLEALSSGVPAVVTPDGGPAHIVRDGVTGRVVADEGFAEAIAELAGDGERLGEMRLAARAYALGCSWDAVFEGVVAAYPVGADVVR